MARPKGSFGTSAYRLHKASGRAVVTIDGRDYYLGVHESRESRQAYDRLLGEWLARGRQGPSAASHQGTVAQLVAGYVEDRRENGRGKNPIATVAVTSLVEMYGDTPSAAFTAFNLRALRTSMLAQGNRHPGVRAGRPLSRGYVNDLIRAIVEVFRWGGEAMMVPASTYAGVSVVKALAAGVKGCVDYEPVKPVDECDLAAVLEIAGPVIAAMIRVQLYTGARPGEVRMMRTRDFDMAGDVWTYTPATHKTAHLGKSRPIRVGPKAQAVLRPFLSTDLERYIFAPERAYTLYGQLIGPQPKVRHDKAGDAVAFRGKDYYIGDVNTPKGQQRYDRVVSIWREALFSNPRVERGEKRFVGRPRKKLNPFYRDGAYSGAIADLCTKADAIAHLRCPDVPAERRLVTPWHPHQLRHNAATYIAEEFGEEAARAVLGHSFVATTRIYIDRDKRDALLAEQAIAAVG